MSSELRLSNVSVNYGAHRAVADVSLAVAEGEIVALLGPSGCGKSTILRAIAGLEPLAAGSIQWRGVDLAGVPVHRRNVGLMFQDHALFPHRNVADNIGFGLRMAKMAQGPMQVRVAEMLHLVGLDGFGTRTVGTLSGGQSQRVALARALAPRPDLLLLDEPLGSLDRALRDRLVQEMRSIVTSLGITAVHVTHDHDEAVSVSDRLALMDSGHIGRVGDVAELMANPVDVATAHALGIETVLSGTVGEGGTLGTPFGEIASSGPTGAQAHVLLRPNSVRITETGVQAVVVGSRYRGGSWLIHCALGGSVHMVAQHPERLAPGAQVRLQATLGDASYLQG